MSASAWRSGVQVTAHWSGQRLRGHQVSITCIVLSTNTSTNFLIYACTGHAVRTGHRSGASALISISSVRVFSVAASHLLGMLSNNQPRRELACSLHAIPGSAYREVLALARRGRAVRLKAHSVRGFGPVV